MSSAIYKHQNHKYVTKSNMTLVYTNEILFTDKIQFGCFKINLQITPNRTSLQLEYILNIFPGNVP